MEMKKVSIMFTAELTQRLKIQAVQTGKSVSEYLEQLARRDLDMDAAPDRPRGFAATRKTE